MLCGALCSMSRWSRQDDVACFRHERALVSFMAPGFLTAAVVAALGVVALHFIVTRRARSTVLPTARFVPDVPIAAKTRSIQFSDLLLLAVRILVILLAGAALARPVFPPHRERTVRVIVADVSGAPANPTEVRDSVRRLFRSGDALVAFDTAARLVAGPDSIIMRASPASPGSLSAGLVAALRAGSRVREGSDSVELVIVSPMTAAERDRATDIIRARWPGRARLVRVAPAAPATSSLPVQEVRFASASRPAFSVARRHIDTVGAVVADGNVLVAPFERRWRFTAESLSHARVIARWVDGEAAAIERDSASTCIRSVAVPVDSSGDMLLRPGFIRFKTSLSASCQNPVSAPDTSLARMLTGSGRIALSAQFLPAPDIESPLARWLAALAIVLAIVEMVLRQPREEASER